MSSWFKSNGSRQAGVKRHGLQAFHLSFAHYQSNCFILIQVRYLQRMMVWRFQENNRTNIESPIQGNMADL